MITAEQVAHFRTFGFLVFRQLFTPDEVDLMRREALEIMAEERGDASAKYPPSSVGKGLGRTASREIIERNTR